MKVYWQSVWQLIQLAVDPKRTVRRWTREQ